MKTDATLETITGGRFEARDGAYGAPTRFDMDGDIIRVNRAGGSGQSVDTSVGLGLVALCRRDGSVLGYGTLDIEDLPALADAVDAALGGMAGTPLERLAGHDMTLVLPLDAMPQPVRDMFLEPRVPADMVAGAGLDDAMLAEVMGEHDHAGGGDAEHGRGHAHDHDHGGGECVACATPDGNEELRRQVDRLVAEAGHAVISVPAGNGHSGISYSVGLSEVGWPELVLTGLVGDQGILVVNAAVQALRSSEMRPRDGLVIQGAISVPLRLREVDVEAGARHSGIASERHERMTGSRNGYGVLQLLWPDACGTFPDEDGYDGRGLPDQTLIKAPRRRRTAS